jgi:hypothetical protein
MEVQLMRCLSRDNNGFLKRCLVSMRLLLLGVVVVVAAGCTKPNPASCADNHCSDPARPFCDVDGTIGGEPNTCIAVGCTAGEFAECRGDAALTCNAAGTSYDLLECEFGCGETGCKPPPPCTTPECEKHIIPKYLPTICDTLAVDEKLEITNDVEFDTGGVNCTKLAAQSGAPEICIMHYRTITIGSSALTEYRPWGTRVLALVADYDLLVKGVVNVGGNYPPGNHAGPGVSANMRAPGVTSTTAGFGGAGSRDIGGAGGTTTADGGGGDAGPAQPNPDISTLLYGGMFSGAPPDGAGAATLISCRGKVTISGTIDANGGGGDASYSDPLNGTYSQARGGASGGNVILQGMAIEISGRLFANGGSGGGGGGSISVEAGARGARTTAAVVGGHGDNGADGGTGGTGLVPPGNGKKGSSGGGGGGGSAGWLLTYTPAGVTPSITGMQSEFSPPLDANHTVLTN